MTKTGFSINIKSSIRWDRHVAVINLFGDIRSDAGHCEKQIKGFGKDIQWKSGIHQMDC